MHYSFTARGHGNITGTHKTTLEFTKDSHVTTKGDCIVGVNAMFDAEQLKKFLCKKIVLIRIAIKGECEECETVTAVPNPAFSDENEMVIRTTGFISTRTFATRADKASINLSRKIIELLKQEKTLNITIL